MLKVMNIFELADAHKLTDDDRKTLAACEAVAAQGMAQMKAERLAAAVLDADNAFHARERGE